PGRNHAVLGGDFFDVIETPDGRVRAVIGDVMGHGPDEAALGVHLRVAWRTLLLAGTPDEAILPTLARLLEAEQADPPRYVTVCDLCVDDVARYPEFRVGAPLGVRLPAELDFGWPENRLALPPGSSVLMYTDGL